MYNAYVNILYGFFPMLTDLRISIMHSTFVMAEGVNVAPAFFEALPDAPALPATFQRLCISWNFDHESAARHAARLRSIA
ncbi:hypothetical protein FB451DRAFT_1412676 [Mycena latifolia]|nr:hypothetical protein FB451DRAFT_1412676 [Mycena latifolia]